MNALKTQYELLNAALADKGATVTVHLHNGKKQDIFDGLTNIKVVYNSREVNLHGYSKWYTEVKVGDTTYNIGDHQIPKVLNQLGIDRTQFKGLSFEGGKVIPEGVYLKDGSFQLVTSGEYTYKINTNVTDSISLRQRRRDDSGAASILDKINQNFLISFNEELGIYEVNEYWSHIILAKFADDTAELPNGVTKIDLKPFDINSVDFTKQNTDPLKVYVIRHDTVYGYFTITPEQKSLFHTCHATGHLLTGLSNDYNERTHQDSYYYTKAYYNANSVTCEGCGRSHFGREFDDGLCHSCEARYSDAFDSAGVERPTDKALMVKMANGTIGHPHRSGQLTFLNVDNETDPLFMGVELEVDTGHRDYDDDEDDYNSDDGMEYTSYAQNVIADQFIKKVSPDGNLYAMWDGSLVNGFEIATHPATLASHMKAFNYKEGFDYLVSKGYNSHTAGTCGLHIHLSRRFFGNTRKSQLANAAKMAYFMEKNWPEVVRFTRRYESQLDRWSAIRGLADSVDLSGDYNEVYDKMVSQVQRRYGYDKYVALNLQHPNTFEFRIFRGTLKYETYIAALTFVDTLARKIKKTTMKRLTSLKFSDIIDNSEITKNYWNTRNGGN